MTDQMEEVKKVLARIATRIPDDPNTCTEMETTLSANLYILDDEYFLSEQKVAEKWAVLRATSDTDKQADNAIKRTEEWIYSKRCDARRKTVLETIRSLRRRVKALEDSYGNQR